MRLGTIAAALLFALPSPARAVDAAGLRIHPLYGHLDQFEVVSRQEAPRATYELDLGPEETMEVEGATTIILYRLRAGEPALTAAQLRHAVEQAIDAGRGLTLYRGPRTSTYEIPRDLSEDYVQLIIGEGATSFTLALIEVGVTKPVPSARDLFDSLERTGRVRVEVDFEPGRAKLDPDSKAALDTVVALLQSHRELEVAVEVHSGDGGNPTLSRRLSEKRALALVRALVEAGIETERLMAVGLAEERSPLAKEAPEGRNAGWRVELVWR